MNLGTGPSAGRVLDHGVWRLWRLGESEEWDTTGGTSVGRDLVADSVADLEQRVRPSRTRESRGLEPGAEGVA